MFDIFKKIQKKDEMINSNKIEYIIVGLGNPGKQYEETRHNVGFMAIDYIEKELSSNIYAADKMRLKFKSLCNIVSIEDKKVLLLKPQTFMNLSGTAVKEAMDFYKVSSHNVIVLFDDISLEEGKIMIRRKGSDGGHNGLKNIIYLSAKDNFPRIKIGVGAKPHPGWDLADWVLSKFSKEERKDIDVAIENSFQALKLMVAGKTDEAMNKFNS